MLISSKLPPHNKLKKDVWRDVYLMGGTERPGWKRVLPKEEEDGRRLYPAGDYCLKRVRMEPREERSEEAS